MLTSPELFLRNQTSQGLSVLTGFSKAKLASLVVLIWLLGVSFQIALRSTLLEFLGTQ
jgi:hypothetical protein